MLQKWWDFFLLEKQGKKWTDSHFKLYFTFHVKQPFIETWLITLNTIWGKKNLDIQVKKCLRTDTFSRIWISQVLWSEDAGNSALGLIISIEERPPHLILFPFHHLPTLQNRDWDLHTCQDTIFISQFILQAYTSPVL